MTSATFRCLRSGHTVTFTQQVDIDSMKFHPDYEQVVEAAPVVADEPVKKPGRPPKAEAVKKTESTHEGE